MVNTTSREDFRVDVCASDSRELGKMTGRVLDVGQKTGGFSRASDIVYCS